MLHVPEAVSFGTGHLFEMLDQGRVGIIHVVLLLSHRFSDFLIHIFNVLVSALDECHGTASCACFVVRATGRIGLVLVVCIR